MKFNLQVKRHYGTKALSKTATPQPNQNAKQRPTFSLIFCSRTSAAHYRKNFTFSLTEQKKTTSTNGDVPSCFIIASSSPLQEDHPGGRVSCPMHYLSE